MWSKQILLALVGFSAGLLVSAGVFTVLLSVGLVPRFAGKTHTNNRVFLYEEMIVFGTILGTVLSIFSDWTYFGAKLHTVFTSGSLPLILWDLFALVFVIAFGLYAGIFVGCLALAIAEMLDSIPIFARRISFRHGVGLAVLFVSLGKFLGSLLYFSRHFFEQ